MVDEKVIVDSSTQVVDENNSNDLNIRLVNIINQMKQENQWIQQPVKFLFIE